MLDQFAQKILDAGAASGLAPVYTLPVEEGRTRMRNGFILKDNITPIMSIENLAIPCPDYSLGIRVYRPSKDKKLPCLIFFHGGGWTINDLDTHDDLCRCIANSINCLVVSVDYRRAPEYKFPVQIEDSYIATSWVFNNSKKLGIDVNKIGVSGDSSGGCQAAVVCLLARDRGEFNIKLQWLAYPVTDYYYPGTNSYQTMAKGYSLNRDFLMWFWNNYIKNEENLNNPYLCPLRAKDLKNLPKAFIMVANYDPLHDEGVAYGQKLKDFEVETIIKDYPTQMHGFLMQRRAIPAANEAFNEAMSIIKTLFEN